MKTIVLFTAAVLTAGCASVTEQQREAREYRDAEWRAEFIESRADCRSKGGRFVVQGGMRRVGRGASVSPGDSYTCQTALSIR